ncbi:nucleoside permease [Bacteroidales bacterium OttesenSCG-928-B11]|nr:nucleoside permease [Bacteroidales bacterium OttesenSCG-928-E04]MDL2308465.1 nucleoside permease [Bacteroidales bacterium OttesenSCG-928-C03]MDL2311450.1 nucleoside permease [Bacteroidales bacterium OttesenSCG-928-B11]
MNTKLRLIIMNFLQYAIWGAWLISLGSYLGGILHFSGSQIGSFFATMGIASLFMPGLMGIIADRWIPAQKLLGICHIIAAAFMFIAAQQTGYGALYPLVLLSVMFFMPTIALSNSVAYNALDRAGLDSVKHFPPIRVWGTVGFIVSMIAVSLLGWEQSPMQLYLSGTLGIFLGLYSFTLPASPINKNAEKSSLVDKLGLRAFTLFKDHKMAVFFIFSMLLGMMLQVTNAFANPYIKSFGELPQYANTFGVKYTNILISLSQISEAVCILLIPFFLKKFGIKKVMLISMFAWVLRFGLLGAGNPGPGLWMFILSMLVYGVAFDFFNISGSLFVDQETDAKIRSSAQGVFMMMTNGFGAFFGSYAAGYIINTFGNTPTSWYIFAGFALIVAILFAILFKYKYVPEKMKS